MSIYSGGAITWASQRQQSVSLSTTEAKFVASSQATQEAIWLNRLFDDIAREHETPSLLIDNQSAITLIQKLLRITRIIILASQAALIAAYVEQCNCCYGNVRN